MLVSGSAGSRKSQASKLCKDIDERALPRPGALNSALAAICNRITFRQSWMRSNSKMRPIDAYKAVKNAESSLG